MLVKGHVNGIGPLTFILDTGATETVITPPTARRTGIDPSPAGAGQPRGFVRSLRVGDTLVHDLPVYVFDPPQAIPLRLDKGINYHGILGYTFLARFVTTIDYCERWAQFDPLPVRRGSPGASDRGGSVAVSFDLRNRLIHAQGRVNDRGPLTFLVDTGSAEVLLLPRTAAALGIAASPMPDYPGVGFSSVDGISLGAARAANVPTLIHQLEREGLSSHGYHGILGYPFLSNFRVTINYRDRVLMFRPHGDAAARRGG